MEKKILIIGLILIAVTGLVYFKTRREPKPVQTNSQPAAQPQVSQNDKPQIVATKPDLSKETIISATQTIEITFNRPLENVGEFKVRIEPKIEYKVELSGDRKTAKIIPIKSYPIGTGFTLTIGPDSKFDGVGNWGETKTFHFRTIRYTGV